MLLENDALYKIHKEFDVSLIDKRLEELDESIWNIDVSRQAYGYGPHNRTNSIILNYCRGEPEVDKQRVLEINALKEAHPDNEDLWGPGAMHRPGGGVFQSRDYENFVEDVKHIERKVVDEKLNSYTDAIVEELEREFNGIAGLVLYVKLPAHTIISTHIDRGYYLSIVHRLHIPIKTNDNVFFQLKNTTFNMKKGVLYEINNSFLHGVNNSSDEDRIHLIVDIIPKDKIPV